MNFSEAYCFLITFDFKNTPDVRFITAIVVNLALKRLDPEYGLINVF